MPFMYLLLYHFGMFEVNYSKLTNLKLANQCLTCNGIITNLFRRHKKISKKV